MAIICFIELKIYNLIARDRNNFRIIQLNQTTINIYIDHWLPVITIFNRPNCGRNLHTVSYQFLICTRHTRFRETLKIAFPRKTVTRLVYFCSCISSYLTLFMRFSIRFPLSFPRNPAFTMYHDVATLACI